MPHQTIKGFIKDRVADIGLWLFLWGAGMTEEEYHREIFKQEYRRARKAGHI